MKNEEKYYKFELNMTIANIIAIVETIILLFLNVFLNIVDFDSISVVMIFVSIIIYTVVHEIFHGIAFMIFSEDRNMVKYGALLEKGVCYAACQSEVKKVGIIISLLFPLIFLTIIPLPFSLYFHNNMLTICCLYNFIGAIGDIIMTFFIFRLPKNIKYIDYDITVGATFISSESLEKYSSKIMKLIDSGKHQKDNINTSIKRIYISKASLIIFLVLMLIIGASIVVNML